MNLEQKTRHIVFILVPAVLFIIAIARTENGISYCIGFALPVLVYGIFLDSFRACGGLQLCRRLSRKEFALLFGIMVLYMVCIFAVIVREDFIYYWDYGSYWHMSVEGGKALFNHPIYALKELYASINTQEYNLFLAWILMIPLKLLGNSYLAFVLLTAGMFFLPAMFLIAVLGYQMHQKYSSECLPLVSVVLMVLSITVPLFPLLSGYVDSAALLPLSLCVLLAVSTEYAKKMEWKKSIEIGILLVMALLMRRYYGFAVVGVVVFLACYVVFGEGAAGWKSGWKYKVGNVAVTGVTSAVILLCFFRGFLVQSLFSHYQDAYAAYQIQPFADKWKSFCLYYGMAIIVLAACPVVFAWKCKVRYVSLPLLLSLVVSMLLFYRIQDFGEHHYYITAIPVMVLAVLGYGLLRDVMKRIYRSFAVVFTAVAAGICILNFGFSLGLIKRPQNNIWFIQRTYSPKIRHDRASLLLLEQELERLDAKGYRGVYVVASSGVLNDDILGKLHAPSMDRKYEICQTAHVDLRDGFCTDFFDADVVVVCDPLQVHLAAKDQCVIALLQGLFTGDDAGRFKRKYALTASYVLDGGVTASVYVKQQKLDLADVQYVKQLFEERYPGDQELFGDRFDVYNNSQAQ